MPLLTELLFHWIWLIYKATTPRGVALIMEETRCTVKESDTFWHFRNMLEMNNIQREFLEGFRS
jgi:hypothetical protein